MIKMENLAVVKICQNIDVNKQSVRVRKLALRQRFPKHITG